ncbi:MAG: RagB/SusD family nutrient uptake outer membrane protein [Tannerella sp.]|jgi:hypothetical protein|nr:RagB/SusD family nutrient uptake outer membrane protein [Tannerella sp.]
MKVQLYKWEKNRLSGIKAILLALMIPVFSQCTDLDEIPYTDISSTNFYTNEEDFNIGLNSVYARMQNLAQSSTYNMRIEVMTEFNAPAYAKDDVEKWSAWLNVNDAGRTLTIWPTGFDIINRANVVLARGENIAIDQEVKERKFGEARFIRAWTNFHLMRIYGRLPIPEKYTEGLSGLEIPRKSLEETYAHIIGDLEYAENKLPSKSVYMAEKDRPNIWRVSKEAAQGLLAKVYLYRASMQDNQSDYQKCKEYCDKVIKTGIFDLEENFEDLWYWYNPDCKFGKESVFEINYGKQSGEHNNLHVMFGVNVTEPSVGCYMYRRIGPSIDHYISYAENDTRRATFLTEYTMTATGERHWFDPENKGFYPNVTGKWSTASPGNIKYYDRTPQSSSLRLPSANIYVIRYADILLMYAEADNKLSGPTSEAAGYLNKVRTRAGLEPLSGMSRQDLDDAIYRERGWEFTGESQLYFDGLRTGRLAENVKKHLLWGKENGIYMYTYDVVFLPTKNFLWKIPQTDLDSNPALEQNPDNTSAPF